MFERGKPESFNWMVYNAKKLNCMVYNAKKLNCMVYNAKKLDGFYSKKTT